MEIIFHSHANKTHFHKKGCAPSLILKVRVFGTRKWSIPGLGMGVDFMLFLIFQAPGYRFGAKISLKIQMLQIFQGSPHL